ncbi:hypothetical protein SARC_05065 [Sphaeroforma arctica JP610]|uniref:Uncharacterized protein n=1 Tax=Sphaeroforma arctica JP610 TaxID=667725 RepID=A0A0L0G0S8_9EUKA|nr:hypothetical protein SARC_05065 [Sphaeroforma arctica JP610]KNC82665.1 hypothetical protein SARC_05065 [Sphaeroforma arctica JP610]|eukprot:XP_014156567.1 hypothetical protein SARC_05065 [Sphaeroforma arctica JP610]
MHHAGETTSKDRKDKCKDTKGGEANKSEDDLINADNGEDEMKVSSAEDTTDSTNKNSTTAPNNNSNNSRNIGQGDRADNNDDNTTTTTHNNNNDNKNAGTHSQYNSQDDDTRSVGTNPSIDFSALSINSPGPAPGTGRDSPGAGSLPEGGVSLNAAARLAMKEMYESSTGSLPSSPLAARHGQAFTETGSTGSVGTMGGAVASGSWGAVVSAGGTIWTAVYEKS